MASAKPGEPVKIRVRGSTSLEGTNEPLYVIDGIPAVSYTHLDVYKRQYLLRELSVRPSWPGNLYDGGMRSVFLIRLLLSGTA